jgi:phosphoinositide-3-kinase regulatory subunit 4
MDIFSAGCVLIELFTDANAPFNFAQLLAYRAGEYAPEKILDKIEDPDVKTMLETMIQKDPNLRKSANEHLLEQRGKVFPDYFYTFLQAYMQIFSTDPNMVPDHKVSKIHENVDALLDKVDKNEFDVQGLTLIGALVTSNIRSLKFCEAKVQATEILGRLAKQVASEIILDRILPHVVSKSSTF